MNVRSLACAFFVLSTPCLAMQEAEFSHNPYDLYRSLNGEWFCPSDGPGGHTRYRFSSKGVFHIGPIISNGVYFEGITGDILPVNPEKGVYVWTNKIDGALHAPGLDLPDGRASSSPEWILTFKKILKNSFYINQAPVYMKNVKPIFIKCSRVGF